MASKTYDAVKFLKRALIHTFEERLELKARDLNDVNDIYVEAINELAGRLYILYSMADVGDTGDLEKAKQYDPGRDITTEPNWKYRDQYTVIENFPLLNYVRKTRSDLDDALVDFEEISSEFKEIQKTLDTKFNELSKSLETLSGNSATKSELSSLIKRYEIFYDDIINNYATNENLELGLDTKQNKLEAGANIVINGNVISAIQGGEAAINYNILTNKPSLNNVQFAGNMSYDDLNLYSKDSINNMFTEEDQKITSLETNVNKKISESETKTNAKIKEIEDMIGEVETALSNL